MKLLISVGVAMVMVGCATSGLRSAPSTALISQHNTQAQGDINSALDAKDKIYQLEKQNQVYDNKEIHLLSP